MSVRKREVRSITVVYPKGRFYGDAETDELESCIMTEANAGNTMLVINLQECDALNSVAIGVLMRGYANYRSRGGEVKLCCLGKRLKDLFTMTKLIMVFDHHDTEDEALASFATPAQ